MFRISSIRRAVFAPLVVLSVSMLALAAAYAEGLLCQHCRACNSCGKICRLVKSEKKITTTCWASKDEDFCLGGPSRKCEDHCEMVCDEKTSDPSAPCAHPKRMVWTDWIPSCQARMYTKHKLMKKTVTKTVPSWKWVVEDLCADCKAKARSDKAPAADVPPVPKTAAKIDLAPVAE